MEITGEYEIDEYGTVLPTMNTAMAVARQSLDGGALVALKLGEGTMMNCLFVIARHGKPVNSFRVKDLNVAIDRTGFYQFNVPRGGVPLSWGYVHEKLGLGMEDATVMAQFIEQVSNFIEIILSSGDKKK